MLEFLNVSKNEDDAIAILKNDHDKVKSLFEKFEDAQTLREKKKIADEAIMELKIHAEIEEKMFYPTVRKGVNKDLMNEADEEHHVAKLLIAELSQIKLSDDHWEAKFTVLAENIRHHIREEEGQMLPQARQLDVDFESLGQRLLAMKQQLKKNGVPPSDEEKLMSRRNNARADSPAKAARKVKRPMRAKSAMRSTAKRTSAKRANGRKASASHKSVKRRKAGGRR